MKKLAPLVLSLSLLFISFPMAAHATSSDTEVINTHGSKTYMGTYEDWNDTWDSDNFTDVTDEDIDASSDLIIRGGKVGDVTVDDEADLTIKGGTMSDVSSDGAIDMSGGKADSLQATDEIEVSGGAVAGDVESDDTVTLTGPLTVGGTVSATDVEVRAADSGGTTAVSDGVSFSGRMTVEGSHYSLGTVDGQSDGTLEFASSSGSLPAITDVAEVSLESGSRISTGSSLDIDSLSISDDSVFTASSPLTVGSVSGPGVLSFDAGELTVTAGLSNLPIFHLNGTPAAGTTAFKANTGAVSTGDVLVFGYSLTKSTYSSSYDGFVLSAPAGNGVTLSSSSLSLAGGSPATLTATVTPALSNFASGTQLCWKLIDPSSKFTISPNSGNNTCAVSVSDSSAVYQATLAAYLADLNGNVLSGYRTASCTLTASPAGTASSFTSDTHTPVAIQKGKKYQARVSSSSYPNVVAGTGGIVSVRLASRSGNDYYFAFTAVKSGSTGIYVNKSSAPVFICNVG